MKISDVLSPSDYADVQRILGQRMPPELRAEIEAELVRNPPSTLTPAEREVMYGVDDLDQDKLRAEIAKLHADVRRLNAEARAA